MRRSAFLSLAAILAATPAFAGPLTLLPTGHWTTPVMVNGQGPFEFVVDTAASTSAVFPALRERLALKSANDDHAEVHGASGAQSFQLFRLDNLALDGRSRANLVAVGLNAVPNDRISAGIVGVDLLSHYIAEFDFPGGQLRLHDPDAPPAGRWRSAPLTLSRTRFVMLEGALDGRPIAIVLDTGARRTIVNWAAAGEAGVARDAADLRPAEPVGGATDHRTPAQLRDFRTLAAGPLTLGAQAITISDLPVFRRLGLEGRPAMILGIDRLRTIRFAIDYPRSRLLFQQARTAAR